MIISNNLVFLDVRWFGNNGIIATQDLITHEYKFYIQGESELENLNEQAHIKRILAHGRHFPNESGELLFKHLKFCGTPYKHLWPEKFI